MLQSMPKSVGPLHSVVTTLYAQVGCNSEVPGEECALQLLEVLSEGGRFVKLSELGEAEGKMVHSVSVFFDTYQLGVSTNIHTSTYYQRKDWCCLIPTSEFEVLGPDDKWVTLQEEVKALPSLLDASRTHFSLECQNGNWNIIISFWKSTRDTKTYVHRYFPGEWRFRGKREEPSVLVPQGQNEKINYVQVFF